VALAVLDFVHAKRGRLGLSSSMTAVLVGGAIGILGTVVGWLLSFLTEARRLRKEARFAAELIFFELGLNLSATLGSYHEGYRHLLSRSAWDTHGPVLARIASSDVMTSLVLVYSTHYARLLNWFAGEDDEHWSEGHAETLDVIKEAARVVGRLTGRTPDQVEEYLVPFTVDR
jgi:hypothetical protein